MKPRYPYIYARSEKFVGHIGVWDVWAWPDGIAEVVTFVNGANKFMYDAEFKSLSNLDVPTEIAAYLALKYNFQC